MWGSVNELFGSGAMVRGVVGNMVGSMVVGRDIPRGDMGQLPAEQLVVGRQVVC